MGPLNSKNSLNKKLLEESKYGHLEDVRKLIKAGADVNAIDNEGYTSLMYASKRGHIFTLRALLEAGADVNAKNWYNNTALFYASYFKYINIVRALIKAGADVNAKNKYDITSLMEASYGHIKIVKVLLKAGADPNAKNNNGDTALIYASRNKRIKILKEFLKTGCSFDLKTINYCIHENKNKHNESCLKILKIFEKMIFIIPWLSKRSIKINENIIREAFMQ
jgi:ankyrin repeat protein